MCTSSCFGLTENGWARSSSRGPTRRVLRIEYVEVAPELRGTGLGRKLVEAAVDWAKETDQKVVPICSYARMVIQRDPGNERTDAVDWGLTFPGFPC